MRTALEDARARGTSLAFFGGNDLYRHIRFESSPLGPDRVEVNYKFAAEDPLLKSDPKDVTNQWRDPPVSEPEQGLLGAQYEPKQFVIGPWRPSLEPRWLFRGTGFTLGSEVANLVGWEHDSVSPRAPIPAGLVRVAHTGELLRGSTDSTFYVSGSGAGVFDAGTIWFDCGLGPGCGERDLVPHDKRVDIDPHVMPDPRLERLVANLIEAMLSRHFR
jgi:hypothetical protein